MALSLMHDERFIDMAPASIFHALVDQGRHVSSVRTMYRLLHEHHEVRERRNQHRHAENAKPELLATGPNQIWTWDITKLPRPRSRSLLLPLRDLEYFQPLRAGLHDRPTRIGCPGSPLHSRKPWQNRRFRATS